MMRNIYMLLLSCCVITADAQDIHFSQYPYSPLNLSPAQTGVFDGDIRANAFYRQQWSSVTVPYKTFGVAYEQMLGSPAPGGRRNSAGIMINSDRAGDGDLGSIHMMLSYARLFSLTSDSIHFLSAGIQAGFVYRSLDINKLTFDNQFTGDIYDPSITPAETFDRTNYIYPDISAGLLWLGVFPDATASAGVSYQHLLKPDQSLLGESSSLPQRLQMHAGAWLKRDDKISFFPSLNFMQQSKFREVMFGSEIKFSTEENAIRKKAFSIGLHYRMKDALVPSAAIYYDLWRFSISYDVNISDLKTVSNKRGGPELNLTYIMKKIRYIKVKNICPVY
jgi:type IX secretion system PorP/SprF family membrane protein